MVLRLAGADVAGLTLGGRVTVTVDAAGRLVARQGDRTASAPPPTGSDPTDRHNLAVEVRGRQLVAELSPARLGDQLATVTLRLDRPAAGPLTLVAAGGPAEFDNVSAARLYRPVRHVAAPPRAGALLPHGGAEPPVTGEFDYLHFDR